MERFKEWVTQFTPQYEEEAFAEREPEQAFLLGSRWADFALCFLFALILPFVRALLRWALFEPIGLLLPIRSGGGGGGGAAAAPLTGRPKLVWLRKWNESCWKMSVYIGFSVVGFLVSHKERWFLDSRFFWLGCDHFPPCNLHVSDGVLLFYALETGFYLQAVHFLVFHEVRRKDWLENLVHHLATLALLFYSYSVNFTRLGVMVLLLHDVSDIFLEAAKLLRYAQMDNLGLVPFVIFVIVWVCTRLVYFPSVIIRSTLTESLKYAAMLNIPTEPHYTIFNGLLSVLFVLHVYWTWLILKVVCRRLFIGELDDVREKKVEDDTD